MKYLVYSLVLFTQQVVLCAQENPNSNAIQTSLKVRALQEKKAEYHKRTNGESDGYRVKIHFSADKTKAREVQAKFSTKYNDIKTYEEYQQPNFVIIVGDFKTKLEAYDLLKKIKEDYPNAFIVKSKIRPMKLTKEG
ncbi:MAG: SPOR domain-containing protein [Bacteroidia bacterium]|nr:SPOR domain-containing protein [Bacteroidia bacterium]